MKRSLNDWGCHNPRVIVRGFDRPEIWLGVETVHDNTQKKKALLDSIADVEKPGIVYVATRKHAEEIAATLNEAGIHAAFYHAGMKAKEREQTQESFMQNAIEVIVATNAFGMGIDKPDVRFVFHYDICDSIDAYYQEIGRAGRDGQQARALLFYNPKDVGLQQFLVGSGSIETDQVQRLQRVLKRATRPIDPETLSKKLDIPSGKLTQILHHLGKAGIVEITPTGEVLLKQKPQNEAEVAQEASQSQEAYQRYVHSRVEMMRSYAETTDCRRKYLLNYFGEEYQAPCNFCDNCEAGTTSNEQEQHIPFPLNSAVEHPKWGTGQIVRYEGDTVVVLFQSVGYKSLSLSVVGEKQLLKPAQRDA